MEKSKWIWTSCETPEEGVDVLCIDGDGNTFVGFYDGDNFKDSNINMDYYKLDNIIAWTPIPEFDIGNVRYFDDFNMELGNLLWGNSRGAFSVDRERQDMMVDILECFDCDGHGYYTGDDKSLENEYGGITTEHFVVRPYYWGDDEKIAELPNFEYHCDDIDITIDWYKYPLRDSYSNVEMTEELWGKIWSAVMEEVE